MVVLMDSVDIVDEVNALLKLGVGDPYRLEHIKQAYIQNKTIWTTDGNYMQRMREKYLTKLGSDVQTNIDENVDDNSENKDTIHCWKCGKKSPLGANFCMICGSSLFEVGSIQTTHEAIPTNSKNQSKSIGLKIPTMIGIPVLILIIIGGAYGMGFFDNTFEKYTPDDSIGDVIDSKDNTIDSEDSSDDTTLPTETNSKCGTGTVFDPETNSCVLGK